MERIQTLLKECQFSYEFIQHQKAILSAQDGADYFGIAMGQTAPTLILKTDRGFFALVVSGERGKVDFAEIAYVLGCSEIKLASRKEVMEVTGYETGSIPLIGLNLPLILDQRLYRYPFIYGGTGQPTCTLKIEPQALEVFNRIETLLAD